MPSYVISKDNHYCVKWKLTAVSLDKIKKIKKSPNKKTWM